MVVSAIFLLLLAVLILRWLRHAVKWKGFPGLSPFKSVPMVGHTYVFRGKKQQDVLAHHRARYGNVFRLDVGGVPTIILCQESDVHAVYSDERFNARPLDNLKAVRDVRGKDRDGGNHGVYMARGRTWREQREFMQKYLDDHISSSNHGISFASIIDREVRFTVEDLAKVNHGTVGTKRNHKLRFFSTLANNILWRSVTGKATTQNDREVAYLGQCVDRFCRGADQTGGLATRVQMTGNIGYRLGRMLCCQTRATLAANLNDLVRREVSMSSRNPEGAFIQQYLTKIEAAKGDPQSTFHGDEGRDNLYASILDIFHAGSKSLSVLFEWICLYLGKFPHCQEEIAKEIKSVKGNDGGFEVTYLMEKSSYTSAFLEEILRHCPATCNTTFRGYRIPKGSQVYASVAAINGECQRAATFDPSRSGKIATFGVGLRRCPGEKLARMAAFSFLATMVSEFKVQVVPESDQDEEASNSEYGDHQLGRVLSNEVLLNQVENGGVFDCGDGVALLELPPGVTNYPGTPKPFKLVLTKRT